MHAIAEFVPSLKKYGMPQPRFEQRRASFTAWRRYLPLIDLALASDWQRVSTLIRKPDFSRDGFLRFIMDHDLAAPLLWLVKRDDATAHLPSWLLLHLMGTAAYGTRRQLDLCAALAEITDAARSRQLAFLLLKGLHFAERYYGSTNARWTRDLDVLVKGDDLNECANMLESLGYRNKSKVWLPEGIHRCLVHAYDWQRGDISIDVHQNFRVRPGYQIDAHRIFSECEQYKISGIDVLVPSDEDNFLLLLISIASDVEQGKIRAKSLIDFWVLLSRLDATFCWETWMAKRKDEGLHELVFATALLLLVALPQAGRFTGLAGIIEDSVGTHFALDPQEAIALISAPQYSLANRRWFLRHYKGKILTYLNWWLIGGIFRPGSIMALWRAMLPK